MEGFACFQTSLSEQGEFATERKVVMGAEELADEKSAEALAKALEKAIDEAAGISSGSGSCRITILGGQLCFETSEAQCTYMHGSWKADAHCSEETADHLFEKGSRRLRISGNVPRSLKKALLTGGWVSSG
jgi:hypothetical protein